YKRNKLWSQYTHIYTQYTHTFPKKIAQDDHISVIKQNIPRDYNISVSYVPKELAGMCWVKLNIFYLEDSLDKLAKKFGNVSSNKNDIKIFIDMLQYMRLPLGNLELLMYDFECHFRNEQWQTEQYFDYVKDLLKAAEDNISEDCDPPPCPTTLPTGKGFDPAILCLDVLWPGGAAVLLSNIMFLWMLEMMNLGLLA
uniref:Kit ligand n=1 Tax=Oryzias latipes TaxID=8090 RepID=A0A3P9GZ86_ORYLA